MGITKLLKSIFSLSNNSSNQKNIVDNREPECPYCQGLLKKIPGSKTKCPHCGQSMFVRTNTKNIRLLVTQEDANKIDEEWSVVNGTHDQVVLEKNEYEEHRNKLRKQFGCEPTASDIKWGIYNKRLLECAKNGDFGLYRNVRFEMAEHLRQEKN